MKLAALLLFLLATAAFGASDLPPPDHVEEEFNLFLFGFLVIGICIVLFLFAVSLVVGFIAAVAAVVLVGLGVISSAALAGLLHRRLSIGLRALHYQVCALGALPAGIGILWLASYVFALQLPPREILLIGSLAGGCGGLLIAFTFDRIAGLAYRRFTTPAIPNAIENA